MIPKRLVTEYLDTAYTRDDHRWLKDLTEKEVDRALFKLRPRPRFVSDAWPHIKLCFLLGVAFPQFCFWVDMAGGKTVLALELLQYWKDASKLQGAVAMSLDAERLYNWETDITKFGFDLSYRLLAEGNTKANWEVRAEADSDLLLVPYPTLTAMLTDHDKKKQRRVLNVKLANRFCKGLNAAVWDESTKAGHNTSIIHNAGMLLAHRTKIHYGLSGWPFGRDPVLLRNQMNLIDGGKTFGPQLDIFREAFFSKKKNYFSTNPHDYKFTFRKKMQPTLRRMMQHRSITFETREFEDDLPAVVPKVDYVRFPEPAQVYYDKLMDRLRKAKGNFTECKNIFIRLRQIASGFVGVKDDETGDKVQVEFEANPKLDWLLDQVERIPEDRKFLVIYEFTFSGRKISEALDKMGLKHGWLWSGTKDSKKLQQAYDKDPNFRGLVANWRKGGMGLNAQAGNYEFFYESPVSVMERKQAERRMDRPGQLHTVFMRDVVMRDTMDERILELHEEGTDLWTAMKDDPKRFFKRLGI